MDKKFYEILEHTADIRIRVRAKKVKILFVQAARAMFDIIAEKKSNLDSRKAECVIVQKAQNLEELFINWLNELLSLSSARGLVFSGFRIKNFGEYFLEVVALGEKNKGYQINKEIKAATYHQLLIKKNRIGWKAEVIFDV